MQFEATDLPGVIIVHANVHEDTRGSFGRSYDAAEFGAAGLPTNFPQCNMSVNTRRGTLRGMHFQASPQSDPKLVRCTRGRIFDVAVDLRPHSAAYRRWLGTELTHANRKALFIPQGCAHGFLTLEDDCEVFYMMGETYKPELARGVRWNDAAFAITWPFAPSVISERDASWPEFSV